MRLVLLDLLAIWKFLAFQGSMVSRTMRKEGSASWCMRHMGTAGDVVTKIQCSCLNSVSALKLK